MSPASGASFLLVKFLAPTSGAAVGRMKMQRRSDSARLKGWQQEVVRGDGHFNRSENIFSSHAAHRSYIKMGAAA